MLKFFNLIFLVLLLTLASCATLKSGSNIIEKIHPGMTMDEVVLKLGKPDRKSFIKDEERVLHETLYYVFYHSFGSISYYDYMLDFKNGELVAMRQEPQMPTLSQSISIKKE